MRCVILVHLAHRKATGKMLSSLEGKQSRERKKSATTVANFTYFYNGIMVSLSLVAGSVETISIISPCGKQILVWTIIFLVTDTRSIDFNNIILILVRIIDELFMRCIFTEFKALDFFPVNCENRVNFCFFFTRCLLISKDSIW